jgi:small subunit ribosomal protein S11
MSNDKVDTDTGETGGTGGKGASSKAGKVKGKVGASTRKRKARKVPQGIAHVQASYNNTLITMTDLQGNGLGQASSGSEGFSGSRKSTPFAAQVAAEKLGRNVKEIYGLVSIVVYIKGPGPGREAVIKAFIAAGLKVSEIRDVTGIPHNGPRDPKKRRV